VNARQRKPLTVNAVDECGDDGPFAIQAQRARMTEQTVALSSSGTLPRAVLLEQVTLRCTSQIATLAHNSSAWPSPAHIHSFAAARCASFQFQSEGVEARSGSTRCVGLRWLSRASTPRKAALSSWRLGQSRDSAWNHTSHKQVAQESRGGTSDSSMTLVLSLSTSVGCCIPLRLRRADRLRLGRYSGRTESAGTAP
jgi:hypothetical protein